ncbi:S-layer homology domain-containing protein [Domibacillus indicus]|uniref:S-layer homology domain-containing protein n=1 Tax=Domibacillus indicus TaxID=1437523 RepID=UPI00203D553C|nr:S-layer homology domain-containing protein [Domibacillus indicus]MCM3787181.1 S-layer homology domain-containing protein [Domibacillus indicus]
MKKIGSYVLAASLLFPLVPLSENNAEAAGDSLGRELSAVIEAGIMSGYEDGSYKPDNSVTREEFATFLARALQLPEGPERFKDVPASAKLAPYVNAAAAAGIINGGSDGNFSPKATITRQDMALMISNALNYLRKDAAYVKPSFTDIDNISSAYRVAIGKSVSLGIISGYTDGRFGPLDNARRGQAAAFIYRMLEGNLPEPIVKPFETAMIDAAGTITPSAVAYESFDAAKQAMDKNGAELLLKNGKIVYMKEYGGMVFAKPESGKATVDLYADETLKTAKTYVTASAIGSSGISAELQYITSTDAYVKVYLGGSEYFMKPEDTRLVPYEGAKGRGYYSVSNGLLVHHIYNVDTNKTVAYTAGPAPSFMQAGSKYYSWDGFSFYNEAGQQAGREYQYFQFLSGRTKTNYTAAELDAYIQKVLAERQAMGLSKYANATTKSKLIGLGTMAKKAESLYNVNALMIVTLAIHESDYGMSDKAQTINNLFGLKVYDSDPTGGSVFKTVEEGVTALAKDYLGAGYFTPTHWRFNGSVPGNKTTGVNVKYASDPYWGAKFAGHMYTVDQAMGGQDFGRYTIGFTNTPGLNVRTGPSTSQSILYTYKASGMPVTIIKDGEWAEIVSDNPSQTGYVYSTYVNKLPIAE